MRRIKEIRRIYPRRPYYKGLQCKGPGCLRRGVKRYIHYAFFYEGLGLMAIES